MSKAKVEITLTDQEKAQLQRAADASALRLATWAKARLMLASIEAVKKGEA